MSRNNFIKGLTIRRRIFIWALKNYLRYLSLHPHASSGVMTCAIIELVDNFVILQGNGVPEKNSPGLRFYYSHDLRTFAKKISENLQARNFL